MPIARPWHNKHLSITAVTSHDNRRAVFDNVVCAVRVEAVSGELKPMVSS
jgi:hypothetical protein